MCAFAVRVLACAREGVAQVWSIDTGLGAGDNEAQSVMLVC
jgi:hypothetical protein